MTVLKNGCIEACINERGAELTSLKMHGEEYIWQGDEPWKQHSPVLFPMTGAIKNDRYTLNGSEYYMPKHGYAFVSDFALEYCDGKKAVFAIYSDENSKKSIPNDYKFSVIFELADNGIDVSYKVENRSDERMYFSVGTHDGFICRGKVGDCVIDFDRDENLQSYEVNGELCLLEHRAVPIATGRRLELKNEYFAVDALVFKDIKSRKFTLRRKGEKAMLSLEDEGYENLLIWSVPDAPFVCVELWAGFPGYVDGDSDITKKDGIQVAEAHGVNIFRRKIRLN